MKKHLMDIILLGGIITVIILSFSLLQKENIIVFNQETNNITKIKETDVFDIEHDVLLKGKENYVIKIKDADVVSDMKKGQATVGEQNISIFLGKDEESLDFSDKHLLSVKNGDETINILYEGEKDEGLAEDIYILKAQEAKVSDIKFDIANIVSYTKDSVILEVPVDEEKVKVFITKETLNPEAEYKEVLKNANEIEFKYNASAEVDGFKSYLVIKESEVLRFTTSNIKALDAFRR